MRACCMRFASRGRSSSCTESLARLEKGVPACVQPAQSQVLGGQRGKSGDEQGDRPLPSAPSAGNRARETTPRNLLGDLFFNSHDRCHYWMVDVQLFENMYYWNDVQTAIVAYRLFARGVLGRPGTRRNERGELSPSGDRCTKTTCQHQGFVLSQRETRLRHWEVPPSEHWEIEGWRCSPV
jgi:hypothetical protein